MGMAVTSLRYPVEFALGFSNVERLKDPNRCNSSFWKAQRWKKPFGALTTFSGLKVSQVKQGMLGSTKRMVQ